MATLAERIEITAELERQASERARMAWNTYVSERNEQVRLTEELRELRRRAQAPADTPTVAMLAMPETDWRSTSSYRAAASGATPCQLERVPAPGPAARYEVRPLYGPQRGQFGVYDTSTRTWCTLDGEVRMSETEATELQHLREFGEPMPIDRGQDAALPERRLPGSYVDGERVSPDNLRLED